MRQNDPKFKIVIYNMRDGTMDERSTDFLLKRYSPEVLELFESTDIYLMPTWDQTRRITLKYLKTFNGPYVVIRPQCNSCNIQGQNHCIRVISFPSVLALCVGAVVVLLKNFCWRKIDLLFNGDCGLHSLWWFSMK